MIYSCTVLTDKQRRKTINLEGPDTASIVKKIQAMGYQAIDIRAKHGRNDSKRITLSAGLVLEFSQSLAVLLESGLVLDEAVRIFGDSTQNRKLQKMALLFQSELKKGEQFSSILSKVKGFSPLYIGMIRVGEQTGSLKEVLESLGRYLEQRKKLRETITSAMLYPSIILILAIAGAIGLAFFLLPRIELIMDQFSNQGSTNINSLSSVILSIAYSAIGIVILILLLIALYQGNKKSKHPSPKIARLVFYLPLIKKIVLYQEILHMTFSIQLLLSHGMPLDTAFEQCREISESAYLRSKYSQVVQSIHRGDSLSKSCSCLTIFPPSFHSWLHVGERVGEVDRVFRNLHSYYAYEMEKFSKRTAALIEPISILVAGGFMLLLVVKIMVPLLQMYGMVL